MMAASLLASPLSPEEASEAMKSVAVDLQFLWDNLKVDADVQAKIVSLGYDDLTVFAQIEDDAAKVRAVIKEDIGIDPAASAKHRNMCARLVAAWEAAKKKRDLQNTGEGIQETAVITKSFPSNDHMALIKAFAKVHFELDSEETPAESMLKARLGWLESGKICPEHLKHVVTETDVEDNG